MSKMLSKADILFQDKYIIAIDKPSGLMVEPDRFGNPNAVDEVLELLDHPPKKMKGGLGVVYRIDRPVCGVLIFALTPAALKSLNAQVANRSAQKEYKAWVEGQVEPDQGSWTWSVEKSADGKTAVKGTSDRAKKAQTDWIVVKRNEHQSLLQIRLRTGRFHQIRLHASLANHPIVNDTKYGALSTKNTNQIMLQASGYSFNHPKNGERIRIESKLHFD